MENQTILSMQSQEKAADYLVVFSLFFFQFKVPKDPKLFFQKNLFILVSSRGSTSNASAEALGIFGDG